MGFGQSTFAVGLAMVLFAAARSGAGAEPPKERSATPGDLLAEKTYTALNVPVGNERVEKMELRYYLLLRSPRPDPPERVPLLMFLHGLEGRGDDLRQLRETDIIRFLRDADVGSSFVLAVPQCPAGTFWHPEILNACLRDVLATSPRPIDQDRLYVLGFSMGALGAWTWPARAAEGIRFAALVPVAGAGDPAVATRLGGTSVRAYHGMDDDVFPAIQSRRMVTAIEKAGGRAELILLPGIGHPDAARAVFSDPGLYRWLFQQRRGDARAE